MEYNQEYRNQIQILQAQASQFTSEYNRPLGSLEESQLENARIDSDFRGQVGSRGHFGTQTTPQLPPKSNFHSASWIGQPVRLVTSAMLQNWRFLFPSGASI